MLHMYIVSVFMFFSVDFSAASVWTEEVELPNVHQNKSKDCEM